VEVADPKNELGLAAQVAYDRAMFIIYKVQDDREGAIAAYRELQARYPDSKEATRAYRQLGRILCELDKPKEAVAELDKMLATDPQDVDLHASYGWFAFRENCETARGLEVVEAGLKLAPDSAQLHYLRAELLARSGDLAAALTELKAAGAAEPDPAFYKRQIHQLQGRVGDR
jgi:tetratricopeptide (TPR) repeat protein